MPLNIELLESSFNLVAPKADQLADFFYHKLFTDHPQVRPMFPDDMQEQKKHLIAALATIVQSLRKPDQLTTFLAALGQRHVGYTVKPEHYPVVGQTLLAALADTAGDAWSPELEQAWADAYTAVQKIILDSLD